MKRRHVRPSEHLIITTDRTSHPTILLVINFLRGGGAERQMSQMARYWSDRGVNVTVATFTNRATADDFYELPSTVRRVHLGVELGMVRLPAAVAALSGLIRKVSPDAILSFSEVCNVVTWIASLGAGKRCCLAIRTNPEETLQILHWSWYIPVFAAYRFCHKLVVQTQATAQWTRKMVRREVVVINNVLRPMPRPVKDRESLILSVGSLRKCKGFDMLLRAFSHVHRDYAGWRLAIVGEGPQRTELHSLCAELGIAEKVDMPGQSMNVESWLERAGIFVLPSRREGFPNALIEAMAMGVAVISTSCRHGPAEIIRHGYDGLLTPVDDDLAMAEALRQLLDNREKRIALGSAAQSVRITLSEDRIMSEWETILFGHTLPVNTTV